MFDWQYLSLVYSGNPLIRSPMGHKNLAVLTGDRINEVFFFFLQENVWSFSRAAKKQGCNNAGFHWTLEQDESSPNGNLFDTLRSQRKIKILLHISVIKKRLSKEIGELVTNLLCMVK